MKNIKKYILLLFLCLQIIFLCSSSFADEEELVGDFSAEFINDYPFGLNNVGWTENVQGVTHDDTHWYISQEDNLWRVPVGRDLKRPFRKCSLPFNDTCLHWGGDPHEGIVRAEVDEIPDPDLGGFDHYGDPTYFEYPSNSGTGYVMIPIENEDNDDDPRYVVFYRADESLEYMGKVKFHNMWGDWAGTDPSGNLYVPQHNGGNVLQFLIYEINWDEIESGHITAYATKSLILLDEEGENLVMDDQRQGGAISSRGHLLYFSSGEVDGDRSDNGLHVFDLHSRKRIAKSTHNGNGGFLYRYNPNCDPPFWLHCDSPQGLTYWDFDEEGAPNAPHVGGQLHALLLNNATFNIDDQVFFKHYTIEEPDIKNWDLENQSIKSGIERYYQAEESITAGNDFVVEGAINFHVKNGGQIRLTKGFHVTKAGALSASRE